MQFSSDIDKSYKCAMYDSFEKLYSTGRSETSIKFTLHFVKVAIE